MVRYHPASTFRLLKKVYMKKSGLGKEADTASHFIKSVASGGL